MMLQGIHEGNECLIQGKFLKICSWLAAIHQRVSPGAVAAIAENLSFIK